jgi:hypothetical protein
MHKSVKDIGPVNPRIALIKVLCVSFEELAALKGRIWRDRFSKYLYLFRRPR